jgi:peroxiredoxin
MPNHVALSLLATAAFAASAPILPAQRTLPQVQQQFVAEAQQLARGDAKAEDRDALLGRQCKALAEWLQQEAVGDDRWNGRLMLADLHLARGARDDAVAALRGIDAAAAPALLLVTAATMAQHLDQRELRDTWLAAALAKPAPLPERLAMARLLTTVLLEVKAGEAIFTAALTAATDDEQRALVRWHRADAMRDREDLGDNEAFDELERLAKELPGTYWGSVAKDRLRATRLQPGDDAIPFQTKSTTGGDVSLAALRGKGVVLLFWSAADLDLPALLTLVRPLQKQAGDSLAVVGICLDRDAGPIADTLRRLGIDFPVVHDGKGVENDVALRWFVEGPTVHVLDKAGKVAALGLHAGTADGRDELAAAIERACKGR